MAASSPTKPKAPRQKPAHPTFLVMATEAITSIAEVKGSSVPQIQTYIAEKYNLDPELVRKNLKPALAKGLEQEIFLRPKNSDAKGYTGRFKLNKVKAATEEKEKAKKLKEKALKEEKSKAVKKKQPADNKKTVKTAAKSPKAKKAVKSPKAKKAPTSKAKPPIKSTKAKPAAAKAILKTPKKVPKKLKSATPKMSAAKKK